MGGLAVVGPAIRCVAIFQPKKSAEKAFQAIGPTVTRWRMFAAAFAEGLIEFAQQFALVLAEFDRRFNRDVAIQIARVAGTHAFDTFAAQTELFARLGALRQVDSRFALQRRHFYFAAKRGGNDPYGNGAMQVVPVALKNIVFLEPDFNI
jgi:hypothetical protein